MLQVRQQQIFPQYTTASQQNDVVSALNRMLHINSDNSLKGTHITHEIYLWQQACRHWQELVDLET